MRPLIPEGFHAWRTFPDGGGWHSWVFAILAEMYAEEGNTAEGLAVLTRMLEMIQQGGALWYEAELYRLRGELTLQQFKVQSSRFEVEDSPESEVQSPQFPNPQSQIPDPSSEAEGYFLKAINIARQQQAKSWELRATTSLARLWQRKDKQKQAHQMLAEVYNWFTEGFDTKDLQEARTLLGELIH